jgi:hypothetical protein
MTITPRFYVRTILGNLTPLICDPTTKPCAPPDGAKMVDWLDPATYRRTVDMAFLLNLVLSTSQRIGVDPLILAATLTNGAAVPASLN